MHGNMSLFEWESRRRRPDPFDHPAWWLLFVLILICLAR
jgi:hypothetical protein